MSDLMSRMMKAGPKGSMSGVLGGSDFFKKRSVSTTQVPAINIALGGSIHSGVTPGLTVFAGPSKHFKTNMSLVMVGAYMRQNKDAVCLFFDSEFGSNEQYFKAAGVDPERVLHIPVHNIEALKFEVVQRLESIERGDKVILFIDSVGNLASKKEAEDALEGKSKADMTRAKEIKSLFRIITPSLTVKDIPCVCVAHTYECGTREMQVILEDGTCKSLADVDVGERVQTLSGPQPVLSKVSYEDAYVTDVELDDGRVLSFTGSHRFVVDGEWKCVEDLQPGDIIDTCNFINMSDIDRANNDELQKHLRETDHITEESY